MAVGHLGRVGEVDDFKAHPGCEIFIDRVRDESDHGVVDLLDDDISEHGGVSCDERRLGSLHGNAENPVNCRVDYRYYRVGWEGLIRHWHLS